MTKETAEQAKRICDNLERYISEENRMFVLGAVLRGLEAPKPEHAEGATRIDLPALKRAFATIESHRSIIQLAMIEKFKMHHDPKIANSPEHIHAARGGVDAIEDAIFAIVEEGWRPHG